MMVKKEYPQIGETMYHGQLENGLSVYVAPKPEFGKSYAFFATNYGGMDMRFCLAGEWQETPAGVAHFLEHKMFDTEDGNALQDLASNGASPNAFTSSAITGYYFESTQKFEENLRILLSFVSIPYFTAESVEMEQGIIGQEILMIEDDPSWQVFMNLLAALYQNHPIRVSVAGSRNSIAKITPETLYACHRAFYNPANMVLCVAVNVDPEQVCQIAREMLPQKGSGEIPRDYGQREPDQAAQESITLEMEVSTPIFQLGCKLLPVEGGQTRLRQRLLGELAWEALLGTSSPLYAKLYAQGLVNNGFSYGYEDYPGCAFLTAGGESKDPGQVHSAVMEEVKRIARDGIDQALWDRLKKAAYGSWVRALNSFEHICVEQAQAHFAGMDYLEFPDVFETIEKQDGEEFLRAWVTPQRMALSVVSPKGAQK